MCPIYDIHVMDIRAVDLNLLVAFDMLLRLNSVSRAAEALHLSQPAMSFALSKLRQTFGDPLFIRTSRGIRPTPRAEQLARPIQQVLDQIKTTILTPSDFDPAVTQRTFTFNMADVGELVFLPKILAFLGAAAPGANVRTVNLLPDDLAEAMANGEVDLAMGGYFPKVRGAAVYQQGLFRHSFVCLLRKDHPVIGDKLTTTQFREAQHAVVRREGFRDEAFETAVIEQGLSRRVVLNVPHYMAIPLILAESDLIVTVPYAVGTSFARMANLKMLAPPIKIPPAEVKQFWHARYHQDQTNIWIRQAITRLFGETSKRRQRPPH